MRILRSATDIDPPKSDLKQIVLDQARYLQAQTHREEQTDGRISQTIFSIQKYQATRNNFPKFSVRDLARFDAPGEEQYCLRQNRLYKPRACH